jgi:hypothetical protein
MIEKMKTYEVKGGLNGRRKYVVFDFEVVTKTKKTMREKYHKCLICSETRYIQRHHLCTGKTIPLCPIHHQAVHHGDVRVVEKHLIKKSELKEEKE